MANMTSFDQRNVCIFFPLLGNAIIVFLLLLEQFGKEKYCCHLLVTTIEVYPTLTSASENPGNLNK